MEDFKLQPLKTCRTNQTKGVLQYLKPLLLYSFIHSPPLIIPTIRSFLLLSPKLIPTNLQTITKTMGIQVIDIYRQWFMDYKLGLKHLCSNLLCSCHTLVCTVFVCSPFTYLYVYTFVLHVSSSLLLFSLSWGGYLTRCEFAIKPTHMYTHTLNFS